MQCCLCGNDAVYMQPLCVPCAIRELPKLQIETNKRVDRCSTCLRYSVPPSGWVSLRYEGPEMLSYLLKRVPEIQKLLLIDASFIHSEEHSKRLIMTVKIDRTKEVEGYQIDYHEEIEFQWKIKGKHCLECARIASNQTWSSVVQLRQKSTSKRTLLLIEQSILKAGLHKETTDIKGVQDGIDFFYKGRTPALRLVRFIEAMHPAKVKISEELVKMDKKSRNSRYKFAYSIEVPALNKDDLVYLPEPLAKKLSLSQVCVVMKVAKFISFIDQKGNIKDLGKIDYFKHAKDINVLVPSSSLLLFEVAEAESQYKRKNLTEKEEITLNYGRNTLEEVLLLRNNGDLVSTKTFVKGLSQGEKVLGYDITNLHTDLEIDSSIFLLKKEILLEHNWKIKRLTGVPQNEKETQMLIEEIRQNPSLLKTVNLYDENDMLIKQIEALSYN